MLIADKAALLLQPHQLIKRDAPHLYNNCKKRSDELRMLLTETIAEIAMGHDLRLSSDSQAINSAIIEGLK